MSQVQVALDRAEVSQAISNYVMACFAPPGHTAELTIYLYGQHAKKSQSPEDFYEQIKKFASESPTASDELTSDELLINIGAIVTLENVKSKPTQ